MKPPWATAAAPCRPCCNAYSPTLLRTMGVGFAGADPAAWARATDAIARIERQGKSSIRRRVSPTLRTWRENHAVEILQKHARALFNKTVAFSGQLASH